MHASEQTGKKDGQQAEFTQKMRSGFFRRAGIHAEQGIRRAIAEDAGRQRHQADQPEPSQVAFEKKRQCKQDNAGNDAQRPVGIAFINSHHIAPLRKNEIQ
jgi:hypothetical protein